MTSQRSRPPDAAVETVRRYCEEKIPLEHQDKARVSCTVRGASITIHLAEAPWGPGVEETGDWWTRRVAQLRYDPEQKTWSLYCTDSNDRLWLYDELPPTRHLPVLLDEIDDDPTGIFWG